MKCCDNLIDQLLAILENITIFEVELTKKVYTDPENTFIINSLIQKVRDAKHAKIIALSKLRNHVYHTHN